MHGRLQRFIDDLRDQALRLVFAETQGHQRGSAQRHMHIVQRDAIKRRSHAPAAAVAFLGRDEARLAQAHHQASQHDGVGADGAGQRIGSERGIRLREMQEDVQNIGQAAAGFHATILVA
ncbi:hypothetical protein SDC9_135926 [bioreactor metagenome]|uniref:Uncharacterized protein n=1 Tax=bioreactor metagenome TaxID=1076179 RepID=A0A645DJS1_9ZZZZ